MFATVHLICVGMDQYIQAAMETEMLVLKFFFCECGLCSNGHFDSFIGFK